MTVPPNLQPQLDELVKNRDSYHYIGGETAGKTLTVLLAPSAVGKSTIIGQVLELCKQQGIDGHEIGTITTRSRRPDGSDPVAFRTADEGVTYEWMINAIQRGDLMNWSLFPTGDIYATDADSYGGKYNFMPMLPDSLPMFERAGFDQIHVIYITAPVEQWKQRLNDRRNDPKLAGRIKEAVDSLTFAQDNMDKISIINNDDAIIDGEVRPTNAAQRVIDITLGNVYTATNPPDSADTIDAMLMYARELAKELAV